MSSHGMLLAFWLETYFMKQTYYAMQVKFRLLWIVRKVMWLCLVSSNMGGFIWPWTVVTFSSSYTSLQLWLHPFQSLSLATVFDLHFLRCRLLHFYLILDYGFASTVTDCLCIDFWIAPIKETLQISPSWQPHSLQCAVGSFNVSFAVQCTRAFLKCSILRTSFDAFTTGG